MENENETASLLQAMRLEETNSTDFPCSKFLTNLFHQQHSTTCTDGNREANILHYQYNRNDCTIRGMLFHYQESTPNTRKTDDLKKPDGSPMEIEYFTTETDESKATSFEDVPVHSRHENKLIRRLISNSTNSCQKSLEHRKTDAGKTERNFYINVCLRIGLISVVLLMCSIFYKCEQTVHYLEQTELNISRLHKNLLENVYNQRGAIDVVIKSLQQKELWPQRTKVLLFMGTMGVGKTFIADIVKQHFPKKLVHDVISLTKEHYFQKHFMKHICCNLIIIDNLNTSLTDGAIEFLSDLPADVFSLVIANFNIQISDRNLNYFVDYEAVPKILSKFSSSSLYFESYVFNAISEADVKNWLQNQFLKRNVTGKFKRDIEECVLKNRNFTQTGFKGLDQKLSLAIQTYHNSRLDT